MAPPSSHPGDWRKILVNEEFKVWINCLFQLVPELSSQTGKSEASQWATGQDPVPVNLMSWILLFLALLHTHLKRSGKSLHPDNWSSRQKQRDLKDPCVFQVYTLLFQGRKEVYFLSAPETWRFNNVHTDVRTILSFLSPWDLKQLLQYSFKQKGSWCSRLFTSQLNYFFLSLQHPAPCFFLQFRCLICKSKLHEHNILPFTSVPLLIRCTTFKVDIPGTEAGGSWRFCFWGQALLIILEWGRLIKQ